MVLFQKKSASHDKNSRWRRIYFICTGQLTRVYSLGLLVGGCCVYVPISVLFGFKKCWHALVAKFIVMSRKCITFYVCLNCSFYAIRLDNAAYFSLDLIHLFFCFVVTPTHHPYTSLYLYPVLFTNPDEIGLPAHSTPPYLSYTLLYRNDGVLSCTKICHQFRTITFCFAW